jgi:hypothetical protein
MKMERSGQPWTEQEDTDLAYQIKLNKELQQIALKHKRSVRAIRLRFAYLIQKKLQENKSKDFIATYFHISPEYLDSLLAEQQKQDKSSVFEKELNEMKGRIEKLEHALLKLYKKIKSDKMK